MLGALVVWILVAVLLPLAIYLLKIGRPRAVIIGSDGPTETAPRRSILVNEVVSRPDAETGTVYDILLRSSRLFPTKNVLGSRHVNRIVEEEKVVTKLVGGVETKEVKKWKYFDLSEYRWMNMSEVVEVARKTGSGLRALGLQPHDKLTLFASTSRDWLLMALSCYTQNITITTAYDTLGEEGLSFSLNEGEVTTLFTNGDLLGIIPKIYPKVPCLRNVIYNDKAVSSAVLDGIRGAFPQLKVLSFEELQALGDSSPRDSSPPGPEDLACIMYTSGSTGNPKGVMLTHANVVAAVAGARSTLIEFCGTEEYYLAYLPLAHVLEFTVELTCLYEGVAIGYGNVKTLTDSSVRNCKGDIRELRPTMMCGVPAVWEGIRKGVLTKLRDSTPFQRRVFDLAFEIKWILIQLGLPTGLLDRIVFNKIKAQTGGRLKFALSGGAPIPRSTQKFLAVCVCPLLNGYGMTESVAIQRVDQFNKLNVVGPPCPSGIVKLVDVPDSQYSHKNFPRPQGEVWLKGPTVMKGYYKQPAATAEALTPDGWLMTGDIGEFLPDGNLSIIDRKKNLVKLSNGEYIALEKLESVYKTSQYVQNIAIYGDPEQSFCIALVQPIEKEVLNFLQTSGQKIESHDLADMVKNPSVAREVMRSLKEVAKNVGLKPAEIVGAVHVAGEEWTPQNGLLTAAMKLKRNDINKKYAADIKKLYE